MDHLAKWFKQICFPNIEKGINRGWIQKGVVKGRIGFLT